ncbi:MAG: SAM-dependent methyltransferase [Clostridia bacterium]|nr:SAM-dependent methyltransferase [Clostridia bacterium]
MSGSFCDAFSMDGRLRAILALMGKAQLACDVGCDHGYLAAALVLQGRAGRVLASDISPASVEKAALLARSLGIEDRMRVLCADGLNAVPEDAEGYSLALCGMGGELIAKLIGRSPEKARRAGVIVMQPMRGEAELREYLLTHGFGLVDERVVRDSGRYYQVISAKYGLETAYPDGFPKGWYRFGPIMAQRPEAELLPLLNHYLDVYEGELEKARKKGREPENMLREAENTRALIRFVREREGN